MFDSGNHTGSLQTISTEQSSVNNNTTLASDNSSDVLITGDSAFGVTVVNIECNAAADNRTMDHQTVAANTPGRNVHSDIQADVPIAEVQGNETSVLSLSTRQVPKSECSILCINW